MTSRRIVITGTGAVCAAGMRPADILAALSSGKSALGPIRQWDASRWPTQVAGEIPDYAFKPHGGLTGTLIYWKRLATPAA